jgi:RNA polymerase sigma-B factor
VGQQTTPAPDDCVRGIRRSLVSGLARITGDVAVAEDLAHDAIEDEQLEAAVATLPLRHRVVVVLRVHLGYTYAEIADIVGCTPLCARQMYSRSTARLRSLLDEVARHG